MTYCLGIISRYGLVMAGDSRTNAGVDYISSYKKIFDFSCPNERIIILCTSGNLSITQAVINGIRKDLKNYEEINLHNIHSMYEVARYIGGKCRTIQEQDRSWLKQDGIDVHCSFLVGGQIKGEETELYLVYSQGNCIQATKETPFLQIGETKYGKPILDRSLNFDTTLDTAAKCALLSIDSTMKSNISVGPPINLIMYETDTFNIRYHLRLRLGDPYLAKIRKWWEAHLKEIFEQMPNIDWENRIGDVEQDILID